MSQSRSFANATVNETTPTHPHPTPPILQPPAATADMQTRDTHMQDTLDMDAWMHKEKRLGNRTTAVTGLGASRWSCQARAAESHRGPHTKLASQ